MPKLLRVLPLLVALMGFSNWARADHGIDYPPFAGDDSSSGADFLLMPSVVGQLVAVDPDAQLITIRSDDGQEIQFSYTATTHIEGIGDSVQGLAQTGGARVKVYYRTGAGQEAAGRGDVSRALNIEVRERTNALLEPQDITEPCESFFC